MKNKEIEIQVQVENIKPLYDFLKKEAVFIGKNHQIDKYFTPVHRDFLAKRPVAEWLRLRDADGKHSITYKNWYYEPSGRSTHADEYETIISDISQVENIFSVLNIKQIAKVDKTREIYNFKNYEIALDKVVGLGDFVEIEYKGKGRNLKPKEITGAMIKLLKEIDVGKITRNYVGYPFLLLFPNDGKYEEV